MITPLTFLKRLGMLYQMRMLCLNWKKSLEEDEQIASKPFVKMMNELGYDVELTYKKADR